MYISTAYSNPNHSTLEEKIYIPPTTLEEVKEILKKGVTRKNNSALIST